jgi:hypothetical protein
LKFEHFTRNGLGTVSEISFSPTIESFLSPIPEKTSFGGELEVPRAASMGMDNTSVCVSFISFLDLNDIELFWDQFYHDQSESVDASVADSDSIPDLGMYSIND